MKSLYYQKLKLIMYDHLGRTRYRLQLTQEKFSEILMIAPRSYIDQEHGKSLCSTLSFVLFVIYCCDDPIGLLEEIRQAFEQIPLELGK